MSMEVPYEPTTPSPEDQQAIYLQALRSLPGLMNQPLMVLEKIAQRSQVRDYAEQELVLEVGMPLPGLYLILEGQVELQAPDFRGKLHLIGLLYPGEFFGEKASLLSDQISDMTVIATQDLRLLLIPTSTLQTALEQSPRLAYDLGEVMEIRRRAVQSVREVA